MGSWFCYILSLQASRVLQKLVDPVIIQEVSMPSSEGPSDLDETSKSEVSNPVPIVDYSNLFGEEFRLPDDLWDFSILNVLDIGAVEEGILHVLYACASQVDFSIGNIIFLNKHCISVMSVFAS